MIQLLRGTARKLGLGPALLRYVITPAQRLARLRLPDRNCVVRVGSVELEVFSPRRNRIGEALYRTGSWEPAVTAVAHQVVKSGMNVIDVGADIGYFTTVFAALTRPGRVVAFEPIPIARGLCEANIARNQIDNVTLSEFALGRDEREVVLRGPLQESRIDPGNSEAAAGDLRVRLRRFDDLRRELPVERVDCVKIDVEGAEHEVLLGMADTLRRDRPVLIVELHGQMLPLFGSSKPAVLAYLAGFGYRWRAIDGDPMEGPGNTTALFESGGDGLGPAP